MITINNRQFTTVLFDKDGTVLDSERFGIEVRLEYAKQHNFPLTKQLLLSCIGKSSEACLHLIQQHVGAPYNYAEFEKELNAYERKIETKKKIPLRLGVATFIQTLVDHGIQLGMVTSSSHESAIRGLKAHQLEEKFQIVIGADDVMEHKPNPEPYLQALKKLKADPKKTLIFEDSPSGVEAAIAAGVPVVFIRDLVDLPSRLRKHVFFELSTWEEIGSFL